MLIFKNKNTTITVLFIQFYLNFILRRRHMKTYRVSFKYSTNQGKSWISTSTTIKAESNQGAIMQVESNMNM